MSDIKIDQTNIREQSVTSIKRIQEENIFPLEIMCDKEDNLIHNFSRIAMGRKRTNVQAFLDGISEGETVTKMCG